jgi:aldehyde:ferredoxin oxidoreductase
MSDKNGSRQAVNGKILIVDLSTGENRVVNLPEEHYRKFFGGTGLGADYLFRSMPAKTSPLGPANILGFVPGLLTGTGSHFSSRYSVVAKSPLTGTWGDANAGGFFGTQLKRAGFDAVFVHGKAKKPVYLWINDGEVLIHAAEKLWGLKTDQTMDMIRQEQNDNGCRIAAIGPAGEKLSLISAIINDHGRAAARSGLGAVMGSKNLKAIAVHGERNMEVANKREFILVNRDFLKQLLKPPSMSNRLLMVLFQPILPTLLRRGIFPKVDMPTLVDGFRRFGTSLLTSTSSEMGDMPIKNWSGVGYRDFPMRSSSSKISDEQLYRYVKRKYACAHCPLGCGASLNVEEGGYQVEGVQRPEYETLGSFGGMILNDDVESIIKANHLCNQYGLDTISAGGTIAFAMECFENGLIKVADTGDLNLIWGNHSAVIQVLEKMACRTPGIGELLADGVKVASEKIGNGAHQFAMHVAGQELPMHDPRLNPSFATTYITDPTPGRHTQGGAGFNEFGLPLITLPGLESSQMPRRQMNGKGKAHAIGSKAVEALDALGICTFATMSGEYPLIEIIQAVTDWEVTIAEFLQVGERIQNLRQAFNVREGFSPSDFVLPDRVLGNPPQNTGPNANFTIDIKTLSNEFYEEMNWDPVSGCPERDRLVALGLDYVVAQLFG